MEGWVGSFRFTLRPNFDGTESNVTSLSYKCYNFRSKRGKWKKWNGLKSDTLITVNENSAGYAEKRTIPILQKASALVC